MRVERWMAPVVTGDLEQIDTDTMELLEEEWVAAGQVLPFDQWIREYLAEVLEAMADEADPVEIETATTTDASVLGFAFDLVHEVNRTLRDSGGVQRW
ncbi:hypothetical protein [Thioalkalivibrio sp.]|uniref:hypothetical protein n=1 Tax=Thioalkalivibrio sp. TaxID=2093813 RepID=UPI003975B9C3